ncbi:MAG: FAD-binding protein [Endozoicomonas sp. (ex Botrylloides leachii)]|nr:FAD-binding protein [Endozoicomonas sp. (ex Botrylloides leachii)]
MSILIIADHDNTSLSSTTFNTIGAAKLIGSDIHLLVAGSGCADVANEAAQISALSKVLVADSPAYEYQLAENISQLIVGLSSNYSHVLTATTTSGKNFMPRVAALLDVDQISDIIKVEDSSTFMRPIYAGNAIATVESSASIKVITVRASAFNPVSAQGGKVTIEPLHSSYDSELSAFIGEELTQSDRPELTAADIIISGGRGMGDGKHFELLYQIADKLGAAVGASRAAVDAGFVSNDMQVGQTGKIVAPNLYIAVGISGAIQHLAGMKDSKIIVAINKDEDAPIFQIADYGLVADLFEALPELNTQLS